MSANRHIYKSIRDRVAKTASVVKSSQAISEEIVISKLLDTLMKVVLENAGAQLGYLLLRHGDVLRLEAQARVEGKEIIVRQEPTSQPEAILPLTIVDYVGRTRRSLMLNDTSVQTMFDADQHSASCRPASVLCLPVLRRGNLTGVLYLENSRARDAFTPDTIAVLEMLTVQAAMSLENARMYEALREGEEKYRGLFENAIGGICRTTRSGQFIDANPAMARMLGYASPHELLAAVKNIPQQLYVMPEQRSELIMLLDERGVVERFETRLYRKNGSVISVALSACAIRDGTGQVLHYEETAEDITEHKQAEEALRFSEARYRALHRDIPLMIFTLDTEGTVLSINPFAANQLGYTVEELEGQPVVSIFHEEDREAVAEQLAKCLRRPHQVYQWQFRKVRKDGGLLWVEELAQAVYDLRGALNVLVVCQDVTERKRAETLLTGQNRILEMIAMKIPLEEVLENLVRLVESQSKEMIVSILLLDEDGIHVRHGAAPNLPEAYIKAIDGSAIGPHAGSCGTAMYRREPVIVTDILQDPLWKEYRSLAAPHGLHACWSTPIMSRRDEVLGSFAIYYRQPRTPDRSDAQLIDIAIFTARIAIENKRGDDAVRKAHDELEQRVVERTTELTEANSRLKELDRLKSMFIASMSHELRTPLNSVIGFSSILLHEWAGPLNPEQKENLQAVLRSGQYLLTLVNSVIDVSKIEAGKIEPVTEEFDLYYLIAEAVELTVTEARGKQLELKQENIHLQMNADRQRLLQSVVNLLTNAVKFTAKGSVQIKVRQIGPEHVEIAVADTGAGIRERDLPKLFQPFVRIIPEDQPFVPGTGLGLYLTRRLVTEVLHGEVTCMSRYGEGSIFSVKIPVTSPALQS